MTRSRTTATQTSQLVTSTRVFYLRLSEIIPAFITIADRHTAVTEDPRPMQIMETFINVSPVAEITADVWCRSLKGTSGTELKSHGITGINYLAVLCPSSECKLVSLKMLVFKTSPGKVFQIYEQLTSGWVETRMNGSLNQGSSIVRYARIFFRSSLGYVVIITKQQASSDVLKCVLCCSTKLKLNLFSLIW